MSTSVIQRSFASGEIAPALYARVDSVKYATGLRTLYNAYVMRHGGTSNRPGSIFLGEVKDSTKETILIPFVFSLSQSYILEFGDQYMRVVKDDAYITEAAQAITGGVTQANPAVVTLAGHGYSNGDEVYITGIVGMTELNGRNFLVANVAANTFELQYLGGANVDSTGFGAYVSGGTVQKIYEITTPYLEADLFDLRYTQSADVMTIVNNNYPVQNLTRIADDNWTFTEEDFVPDTGRPTALLASSGSAGGETYTWGVTAINQETREESYLAIEAGVAITGATQANPCVVTAVAHGYSNGEGVYIEGVGGMVELNGRHYSVDNVTANTFELIDVDSTGFTAYTAGGTVYKTEVTLTGVAVRNTTVHTISWTPVSGVIEYNVYLKVSGVFQYIGTGRGSSFQDRGAIPDPTATPPDPRNPFYNNYPATTGYYQQRKLYGNLTDNTESAYASRTSQFSNFSTRVPSQDDDAVSFNLASTRLNSIKSFVDLERLIMFTENGAYKVNGNESGVLTPSGINPVRISYHGANNLQPLIVGNSALYVQARGSVVRDLINDSAEGQKGLELSLISAHLVDDYEIKAWTYQEIPHSLIWMVRDDGILLCMTYVRDQEIVGWSRHEFTDGIVEHVASIPGSSEDLVYLVIRRTIDGRSVRYVERFASRKIIDVIDNIFLDSAISFDGRNTSATTMTLSGGTTWDYTETLTLTASASFFVAGDVGNEIQINDTDGSQIRFEITGFTSATVVTGRPNRTVPVTLRSVATIDWAKAVDNLSNLWHLEGLDVSVFADRYVEASPNNAAYTVQTVTNGELTLSKPYAVIHVGIPYISDIETLDIDTAQGETISGKKMEISRVISFMEKSRGCFYGTRIPTGVDPLEGLQELKIRNEEEYDEPVDLLTGKADVTIQGEFNKTGRVVVRQVDPIPMTVLSIVGEGLYPFGRGN